MNIVMLTRRLIGKSVFLSALFYVLSSPSAWAVHVPITAEFIPNPSNARVNQFVNLTPFSGYCTEARAQCAARNIFSVRANVNFASKFIHKGEPVYIKAPWEWKKVTVTHPIGGPQEVEVRVTGVGSGYRINPGAATIAGGADQGIQASHSRLWGTGNAVGNDWVYVPAPCRFTGSSFATPNVFGFFWLVTNSSRCTKTAAVDIPDFSFQNIDFLYELRTPNPLAMQSGTYTGSLIYSVGENKDFDFNKMVPNDSVISLDFTLKVTHALKVEIPPGGNTVELVPEGGWQRWMNGNKAPPRLFRDQPFLISSSTPFKLYVECEGTIGSDCYLTNSTGSGTVPVNVSVTLPNGFTDTSGASINRRRLNHIQGISAASVGNALSVRPSYYVDRSPAILHFEVPKEGIDQVLKNDGPSRYYGKITVIWDADI
ncbi:hypothetical protein [Pseudomonas fluorescens]|nr:hypothetical protein [Pseudomonas fluorescens]